MTNPTTVVDDDSPFNRLPGDILLHILNKLIDLKTLCFCKLVSKRFYIIVHKIDTISFTCDGGLPSTGPCFDFISAFESLRNFTTLKSVSINLPSDFVSPVSAIMTACFKSDSFFSAIKSMNKFTGLESLSIKLLFSKSKQEHVDGDYNRYLFKWKAKLGTCRVDSFCYLSPNSICSSGNGHQDDGEEDDDDDVKMKFHTAVTCLSNAIERFNMMLDFIISFPSMEKVSFTDSAQRGTVSLSGEKITELRNWYLSFSPSHSVVEKMNLTSERPCKFKWCYVPLLELPVSGYVMKGVTLFIFERDDVPDNGNDSFLNIDEHDVGFEDKEVDAAYTEAVIEIFKKIRGKIETL